MMTDTCSDNPLLRYWQDALERDTLSKMTRMDLKNASVLTNKDLKTGQVPASLDTNNTVWIAPLAFWDNQNNETLWLPLWIPARVVDNHLAVNIECPLPWIPTAFFEMHSPMGAWFANLEQYDTLLLDLFFDTQGQFIKHASWGAYVTLCLQLFESLLKVSIREHLKIHYTRAQEAWIVSSSELQCKREFNVDSALIKCYSSLEETDFQEYSETDNDITSSANTIAHYPGAGALLPSHKQALDCLLQLEQGQIQALSTVPGTQKQECIKALIASIWGKAALAQAECAPKIVWLGIQQPLIDFPAYDFSKTAEYDVIHEGLRIVQEYVALNNQLTVLYGNPQAVHEKLAALQQQDQDLENDFERYNQEYAKWRKKQPKGILKRFTMWLVTTKKYKQKLAAQFFESLLKESHNESATHTAATTPITDAVSYVIEKIRKIKVQRTKIHNELVEICQWIALQNGSQQRWQTWLQLWLKDNAQYVESTPAVSALFMLDCNAKVGLWDAAQIQAQSEIITQWAGESVFKFAVDYFKIDSNPLSLLKVQSLSTALEDCAHQQESIDYLIIDNAHRLHASALLPILAKTKRAIFLGDEKGFPVRAITSPLYDDNLLKAYHIAKTEEALEDLAYRGIQANGSAFQVAQAVSIFKKLQIDGLSTESALSLKEQTQIHPMIFEYSHRFVYLSKLTVLAKTTVRSNNQENGLPALGYLSVVGVQENNGLSFVNKIQADALLDWYMQNQNCIEQNFNHSVAIITLFAGQKQYLMERMKQLDIGIPVYLVQETDNLSQDLILFSPVYTSAQAKPHILDQGDFWLNVILTRACQSFLFFGDRAIFNPHTHSPCGHMAKLLAQSAVQLVLQPAGEQLSYV